MLRPVSIFSASWRQLLPSLQVPYLGLFGATSAAQERLETFPGIDAKCREQPQPVLSLPPGLGPGVKSHP